MNDDNEFTFGVGLFFMFIFVVIMYFFIFPYGIHYTDNECITEQNFSVYHTEYKPVFVGKIWIPNYEKVYENNIRCKNGTIIYP